MIIRWAWIVAVVSLVAGSAYASSNAVGGLLIKERNSKPNIIVVMIDDVGREAYPSLGSPFAATPTSQTYTGGESFPAIPPGTTPNLDRLLTNGIRMDGMWTGALCQPSRRMLATGSLSLTSTVTPDKTPKRIIQDKTNQAYKIFGGGKPIFNGSQGAAGSGELGPQDNLRMGEETLGYTQAWATHFPQKVNDVVTAPEYIPTDTNLLDASIVAPPSGNVLGDRYEHMDAAMMSRAMEFIQSDAYGAGQSPHNPWANHYATPFIATFGFHSVHLETMERLDNRVGDRTQPGADALEAQDGTTNSYADRAAARDFLGLETPIPKDPAVNCPGFPDGGVALFNANSALYARGYVSCWNTNVEFVDYQLGRILDFLGTEGLKNTLVIFASDNGTYEGLISNRAGLAKGADAYVPSNGTAAQAFNDCGNYCGKGTYSPTGINGAFVMAYGPVARSNYGTRSKLWANYTDVAETIVQTVMPGTPTGYPDGRDFSAIYEADCVSGCDTLTGFEVTLAMGNGAAAHELVNGKLFRLTRYSGECDWVVNVDSPTPNLDLRGNVGGADADLNASYSAMDAALTAAEGGSGC